MIHKPSDYFVQVCELRKIRPETLPKPGLLPLLNDHYSVKLGNTTIITGYPSCGKSYFLMNMQVALSSLLGWKHILYTPEMGDPEEIVTTLLEIVSGVRSWSITEIQIANLMPWIDDHFKILTFDQTPTMEECLEAVIHEGKAQTFSIDNLNDLSHTIPGTQDIYWEQQLVRFNTAAKRSKMHGFLTAHPKNPEPDQLTRPPAPNQIKGGSAFWSKGQTILSLMRMGDAFTVQAYKIKPRIVGKQGVMEFKVDMNRNTYFQYHTGREQYMFGQAAHPEKPKQQEAF